MSALAFAIRRYTAPLTDRYTSGRELNRALATLTHAAQPAAHAPRRRVSRYLGYSALKDFFPTMEMKPNTECTNAICRRQQAAHRAHVTSPEFLAAAAAAAAEAAEAAAAEAAKPLHEDNEWCICVDNDEAEDDASGARRVALFVSSPPPSPLWALDCAPFCMVDGRIVTKASSQWGCDGSDSR
jgi:hypothetical protein